jgi:hypothetical protein
MPISRQLVSNSFAHFWMNQKSTLYLTPEALQPSVVLCLNLSYESGITIRQHVVIRQS